MGQVGQGNRFGGLDGAGRDPAKNATGEEAMRDRRVSGIAFVCDDCGALLSVRPVGFGAFGGGGGEWFMVKNRVWQRGQRGGKCRFLCVGCLEHRIGRRLTADDFRRAAKVNFVGRKPAKLRRRMRGLKPAKRLVNTTFVP
jgi:hypothetical protein